MSNAAQARFQKKTLIHKAAQIRILPNRKINPFGKGGVVLESPGRPAIAVNSDNEIPLIRNDFLCKWRMESRDRLDIGARGRRPPWQAALRHLEMTRREFFFAQAIFLKVSLVCQTHLPQFERKSAAFPLYRKDWSEKCRVSKCGGRLIFHFAEMASSAWNP